MTVVKSRIAWPDGSPAPGQRVVVRILASPSWSLDKTSQVIGSATTWTNGEGWWQLNILPYTQFEGSDYVFAEVTESNPAGLSSVVHYLRVPDPPVPPRPLLMREVLANEPPGPDPGWRPISSLGTLVNVDNTADLAPDGAVLMKRGGWWQPVVPNLRSLSDIHESVTWANPNDPLVFLSAAAGWGVTTPKPATIEASATVIEEEPRRGYLEVTKFDQAKTVQVFWDDNDPEPFEEIPETGMYHHDYASDGTKVIQLFYADHSESVELDPITIPHGG